MIHIYESTYEDCSPDGTVMVSAEIQLTYTVIWGSPARIHYNENDHPAEGDEIEIASIRVEDQYFDGKQLGERFWRLATHLELQTLAPWVEEQGEEMLQNAREAEADAKAEAEAGAAEARAEFRNLDRDSG